MTLLPSEENAKMLASLLGIEEADAAQRLQIRVAINFDPATEAERELTKHVKAMLSRTIAYAGPADSGDFAAEIVIGPRDPVTTAPRRIYAGACGKDFLVRDDAALDRLDPALPSPLLVIAACYVAAAAVRAALQPAFPITGTGPVVLAWDELFGKSLDFLRASLNIGETWLAGAGAVGHGFIYTLRYFDIRGSLYVTDPKKTTSGGLNRCLFLRETDVGSPKATGLCEAAQADFPALTLIPIDAELDEARKSRSADYLIRRLVVSVDSRRARRSLQSTLPGEVFDASTTDVREIVLHFNRQPTELACLSCIYPESERERAHEDNVAEALGLTPEEVRRGFISAEIAAKVIRRFPELEPNELAGRAFDTVYKELCGVSKLKAAGGQQVLAPFSFVSVLAGAYLAVEFALRIASGDNSRFNYWRVSPWHSPIVSLRQVRSRDPHCEFCGEPVLRRVIRDVWKDFSGASVSPAEI